MVREWRVRWVQVVDAETAEEAVEKVILSFRTNPDKQFNVSTVVDHDEPWEDDG